MDKIAGLKEILELDPKNSFARYGLAMELASRGETAAALAEFDTLLANDSGYTAGYFMAAQTLSAAGRTQDAITRLKLASVVRRAAATTMLSVRCSPCWRSWNGSFFTFQRLRVLLMYGMTLFIKEM
jgi:predicted Zn-dependent protease